MSMEIQSRDIIRQILMMIIIMILCGMLGGLVAEVVLQSQGMSLVDVFSSNEDYTAAQRMWIRIGLIINHGMMFLVPGMIYGYLYHRDTFYNYIKALAQPTYRDILLWIMIIMASYPAVNYMAIINEAVELPSWATSSQSDNLQLLKSILKMDHAGELALSLLLVGVLPALGEEIIFRGILQNKLLELITSPHVAIIIASLAFGLVHGQLGRLLPLSFLGLLLGYAYYYTRSFWVPVVLHFLNNSIQVVMLYSLDDKALDMVSETPKISPIAASASMVAVIALIILQHRKHTNESRP